MYRKINAFQAKKQKAVGPKKAFIVTISQELPFKTHFNDLHSPQRAPPPKGSSAFYKATLETKHFYLQ